MDAATTETLCRRLPQLGRLLEDEQVRELLQVWGRAAVVDATRRVLARLREAATSGMHTAESLSRAVEALPGALRDELEWANRPPLRRVINATGVLLQTNLGRAPLSEAAIRTVEQVARGYCNLELDLGSGKRGRRDVHAEELILRLLALRSGAPMDGKAATVVNNCAAATFLALNTLAEGGEVIVSRGELVEIGGGFRVPEILRKSGAVLREVGTTNRTRISDYAAAITPETRLILRVHRSNFRIEGFTQQPSIAELVALGAKASVPVFEDQGTGCVVRLEEFGIREESSWVRSSVSGVALVSASGDKLLGGPQCGILIGERGLIERIRANPLARAFRPGKLTFAALQATLLEYLAGRDEAIPVIAMLRVNPDQLRERCDAIVQNLRERGWEADTVAVRSLVGGGTTPGASLRGFAVALRHPAMGEEALSAALRGLDPAVIARTRRGRVLLDLRTVARDDDAVLSRVLAELEAPA